MSITILSEVVGLDEIVPRVVDAEHEGTKKNHLRERISNIPEEPELITLNYRKRCGRAYSLGVSACRFRQPNLH